MRRMRQTGRAGRGGGGFTLLEVMLGLALLGLGLTVLIKSAANSIFSARQAHMMGVVTDLARGKMYEIEEILLKDGFSDTEVHEDDKTFEEEGWPGVHYSFKVEEVELPGWEQLQALSKSHAEGSAAGSGGGSGGKGALTDPLGSGAGGGALGGGFADSALGGMLSQFGGFGGGAAGGAGGDIDAAQGGAFIQGQYTMFQQILKVSIRKVSLTVTWQVMGSDRDMKVVAFFTDAAAMDKVISGMGSTELPEAGNGSGSDKGGPVPPGGGGRPPGTPGRGGTIFDTPPPPGVGQ